VIEGTKKEQHVGKLNLHTTVEIFGMELGSSTSAGKDDSNITVYTEKTIGMNVKVIEAKLNDQSTRYYVMILRNSFHLRNVLYGTQPLPCGGYVSVRMQCLSNKVSL